MKTLNDAYQEGYADAKKYYNTSQAEIELEKVEAKNRIYIVFWVAVGVVLVIAVGLACWNAERNRDADAARLCLQRSCDYYNNNGTKGCKCK